MSEEQGVYITSGASPEPRHRRGRTLPPEVKAEGAAERVNVEGLVTYQLTSWNTPPNRKSTPGRPAYRCRFVKAGRVRAQGGKMSNIVVEPGALESASKAGRFDKLAVFVDHSGFFEYPSVRNLAGVTSDVEWDRDTQSVMGTITLYSEAEPIAKLINELLADGQNSPDVGLSIVFWPEYAPRDLPDQDRADPADRYIIGLKYVEFVDLVFQPAADGRILEALSTFNKTPVYDTGVATYATRRKSTMIDETQADIEAEESASVGLSQQPQPQAAAVPASQPAPVRAQAQPQAVQLTHPVLEEWSLLMAIGAARLIIQNSGLPPVSQERLSAQRFNTPNEVERAIDAEWAYLAKLQEDQTVNIGGIAPRSPNISMGLTPIEKLQFAVDAMLEGTRPVNGVRPLTGIRELYHLMSGDYEMTGVFRPERVTFANVNTSTMAYMVANALNKRVVNEFQKYPHWWEPIVSEEDFTSCSKSSGSPWAGSASCPPSTRALPTPR